MLYLNNSKIDAAIQDELKNTLDNTTRVNNVLDKLSDAEIREIAFPVILDRLIDLARHEKTTQNYPSPVTYFREVRQIPRDAAGQAERMTVRQAEMKALAALEKAFTSAQKVAALAPLKQFKLAIGDGNDVPWHELTKAQRAERIKLLNGQIRGLQNTRALLDKVDVILRDLGVETIREAETTITKMKTP